MGDHKYLKEWKAEQTKMILQVHPDYSPKRIEKILDKLIDKNLKNPVCALNNNYIHKQAMSTVLDIYDFIDQTKPIMAGGGVLFKNQNKAINPPSIFLDGALKARKKIKAGLKTLKPGSYEYKMTDLRQMTEKVVANSYYGASGNETSPFFNHYTALATTATGQALISTMMCAFESFYADNIKFYDVGDLVLFVYNSIHRKDPDAEKVVVEDMPKVTIEELTRRLYGLFEYQSQLRDKHVRDIISATLDALTEEERQILYYSSNLFEFIQIPSVQRIFLDEVFYKAKSFKDANSVPDEIQDGLDKIWDLLYYWVVYNHPVYNRINRLKFQTRKAVLTIDTDSNFIGISRFVNYMMNLVDIDKTVLQDRNQLMYIIVNTMAYEITLYTQVVLKKYAKIANIPDEYAPRLNMKNEYLYMRIVLTKNKKNYMGSVRLREGAEILPEKVDIKGLTFTKSSSPPETKAFFSNLVENDVLKADTISGSLIIKKIKDYQRFIDASLLAGEKTFLTPLSVKEPEAYKEPFSNPGIKGTYVWNLIYPDQAIELPDKIRTIQVKMEKLDNISGLKDSHPDIYQKLVDGVYENAQCPFRTKGISVIGIPSQVDKVPDWIIQYIDKSKIIESNVTKIHPILESLGISIQNTRAGSPHFTNIIVF